MAKCTICKLRKGKRRCKADDSLICSPCCGQSRSKDRCAGCSFYKNIALSRNYRKLPFYELEAMGSSANLVISNVIESTFCDLAQKYEEFSHDRDVIELIELFFDKYHFKDEKLTFVNVVQKNIYKEMVEVCEQQLQSTSPEELIKVMGTIYRSVLRRTNGQREYLEFLIDFMVVRVVPDEGFD